MINCELVGSPEHGGENADRWMLFLHGILGTGSNWRSFARKFVQRKPGWGAVLVDLRMHGSSRDLAPPHTVESAARDLFDLPVRASGILGHSFGGKVALEYVKQSGGDLDIAYVIDSTPGARPHLVGSDYGARGIMNVLERAPARFRKRAQYMDWMVAEGIDKGTAQWLTMNVRQLGHEEYELGIDLAAMRALVDDYYALDRWDVVEAPPGRVREVMVLGTRGDLSGEDRARLRKTPAKVFEVDAGHWVHVDAPDALLEIVTKET